MTRPLKIGSSADLPFVVEASHTIDLPHDELPPVLSTPSLIWFLEHAAINVLSPVLKAGEISVGVKVEVQHMAPTPIGGHVVCQARVIQVDGKMVTFQVEARDDSDIIAKGLHSRRIVDGARLAAAVKRKTKC
jgi:fluoroacetyl-CoA thioesterase